MPRQRRPDIVDPQNTLLWHFPRQRLDADALRDAILAVSGQLNPQRGGRGFVPSVTREALEGLSRKGAEWSPSPPDQQRRRSIYLFLKRALIPPLMTTFDAGDTTAPLARRDVTTVAPQALALLNNPFLHAQGDAFAHRLESEVGGERARQVERAFALALGRRPSDRERSAAMTYLNRFPRTKLPPAAAPAMPPALRLWLRADRGVELGGNGRVTRWADQSGNGFDAVGGTGPERVGGALRFDGTRRFLTLAAPVVTSPEFTLVAIASDSGSGGHRELFSNWNGAAGNAGTSVFLGVTGAGQVRFTDAFAPAGVLETPEKRYLLTAVASKDGVAVYQNRSEIARSAAPLPQRNLAPPFVVGQQGNIDGEFWNGEIVELLVFDRALTDREREGLWDLLGQRHPLAPRPTPPDPALASLCRILLNTNEFVYVD